MLTKRGNRNKSKRYASWRLCVRNADSAPEEEWWRKVDPLHHISLHRPMWVGRVRSGGTACYSSAVETIAAAFVAAFVLRWYRDRSNSRHFLRVHISIRTGSRAWKFLDKMLEYTPFLQKGLHLNIFHQNLSKIFLKVLPG